MSIDQQDRVGQQVRDHFEADAQRFDAIYDEAKGPFAQFVDNVWRGVVRRRLDLAVRRLAPLAGKSVLDVGCGSGRFCLAYAQHGAARVVGIDFAPAMIDLARQYASHLGLEDRCEFIAGAFPQDLPEETFDCSTAMGFFDYIDDPVAVVKEMRRYTRATMLMSFPKAREFRVPLRRLRFKLAGCPLYLYTQVDVKRIMARSGITRYNWIILDRDYVIIAHL